MTNLSFVENPEYWKYRKVFNDCLEYVTVEGVIHEEDKSWITYSYGGNVTLGQKDSIYFFLKTLERERLIKYRTNSIHVHISKMFGDSSFIKNTLHYIKNTPNQELSIRLSVEGTVHNRFYVNRENGVAYFDIPKCASSAFRESSLFQEEILTNSDIKRLGLNTIAIIRNPIERIISGFLEIKKRRELPNIYKYYNQEVYDQIFSTHSLEMSFVKMIDFLLEGSIQDSHVLRQSDLIVDKIEGNDLAINEYFGFEDLPEAINSKLGAGSYDSMKVLNSIENLEYKHRLITLVSQDTHLRDKIKAYTKKDSELYALASSKQTEIL